MDNTNIYINMCEKAIKIQNNWDFKSEFNILYDIILKKVFLNVTLYVQGAKTDKKRYIWLPTQAQLQRMFIKNVKCSNCRSEVFRCVFDLSSFYNGYYKYCSQFTSMEQIWLAYVMFNNYQKQWNGKDWINENEYHKNK